MAAWKSAGFPGQFGVTEQASFPSHHENLGGDFEIARLLSSFFNG
jgi:hypothetical protein